MPQLILLPFIYVFEQKTDMSHTGVSDHPPPRKSAVNEKLISFFQFIKEEKFNINLI